MTDTEKDAVWNALPREQRGRVLYFLQKEVIAVSLSIIQKMNEMLLTEMPEYRAQAAEIGVSGEQQRRLLRALMNVRPPRPLSGDFLALQDQLLSAEREARGVVDVMALPSVASDARIALWQGDITRLAADAIVNAANAALLGCFIPCHRCIDNAIHSAAGLQLREACAALVDVMALPSVASDARIALYAPCGGLRAHRPRAECAADSDSLVFASDRFSCPMRVPMLYYFLYHDAIKIINYK